MKIPSRITLFLLTLITILSLSIRFYNLGDLPWNMQEDEVMTGYVGRYIIENGKDVYGNKWPLLYFDKFGDYYIIGPIYMKGLSTLVFGMNAFAVRFPTALFGALTVIPIFLLARLLFASNAVGLFSAFAMAIMPWTIPLGRASSEGILGGFFFLFGLYYVLLALKEKKMKFTFIGALFILFTFWIYHNYRLLSSLFVFGIAVYGWLTVQKKYRKVVWATGLVAVLFVVITVAIGRTSWGRGRFDQTGILSPLSGVSIRTQELIYDEKHASTYITRFFHNKVLGYGREFLKQYFIYFSGDFLFIKGGKSESYAVPESGLLYIGFIIPILLSLRYLVKNDFKEKQLTHSGLLLLYFIAISPVPSALTIVDAPNIQRSILLGLFFSLLVGLGMKELYDLTKKNKSLIFGYVFLIGFESILFMHNYIAHTDSFTSMYRNDAQRELIARVKKLEGKVYLPTYGTMSMYYLFYNEDFSESYTNSFTHDVRIKSVKNIEFLNEDCATTGNTLFVENSYVVTLKDCQYDEKRFKEVELVKGKNQLLGYRILQVLRRNGNETTY